MIEGLLYMILHGVLIGVLVSAPMGPVGIFCIQRTLDKGRRAGFDTGIGAALSDLTYCLLTGFCLSFIEEFIQRNRMPIQLFGSAVLILFGIYLLRKKPVRPFSREGDVDPPSRSGNILKGFLFTFSNPLILFLIIGLFAQFNFVIEGMRFYHYVLGFVSIFAGALGWWWLVTYFVDKLRAHFNVRSMWLINRAIGIIILIFAAFGIYVSVTASPSPAPNLKKEYLSGVACCPTEWSFRVADKNADPKSLYQAESPDGSHIKVRMPGWHVRMTDSEGEGFNIEVRSTEHDDPFQGAGGHDVKLTVTNLSDGREIQGATVTAGLDPYKGKNAWRLTREGDEWMLFAGNREWHCALNFHHSICTPRHLEIFPNPGGDIDVTDFEESEKARGRYEIIYEAGRFSEKECKGVMTGPAGIYSLFDYEHDDAYAKMGGNYRLAIVEDSENGYDIVYLSGAKVMEDVWKTGMRKGHMSPSVFRNIYDVSWTDSEGRVLKNDVQAEYDPIAYVVTFKFPYQNSSLRFKKE